VVKLARLRGGLPTAQDGDPDGRTSPCGGRNARISMGFRRLASHCVYPIGVPDHKQRMMTGTRTGATAPPVVRQHANSGDCSTGREYPECGSQIAA
jgi:hypothetical protein